MQSLANSVPDRCKVASQSILGEAINHFNNGNAQCRSSLTECLASNTTDCGVVSCDAGKELLATACIESDGSYCTGMLTSPGVNTTLNMPKFGMSTALCLPSGCGESDVRAVSLIVIDEVCGSKAEAAKCTLTTNCDFELGIGSTFAIVLGVCGTAACVFLLWYCLRRWQKKQHSRGPSATTRGLLAAAGMDDSIHTGPTYANLSPQPDEAALGPAVTYSLPQAEAPAPTPAQPRQQPKMTWAQRAAAPAPAAYSATANVGNDAVLESGASGL
mgnify:CR=1 FL=1